jgi:hypothetical protein
MNKFRFFVSSLLFLFISVANADNSKSQVCAWAEQVLMQTLSVRYDDSPRDVEAALQRYYMPSAWGPMKIFFTDKRDLINKQKLILHPRLKNAATVISQGKCAAGIIPCWRVNLEYSIPELHHSINFSLLIFANSKGDSPFIIQSLDMIIKNTLVSRATI